MAHTAQEPHSPAATDAIVVTGASLITSLGATREQTWRAVDEGRCGMGPLRALEQQIPDDRDGGQAVDLDDEDNADPSAPREARYLARAIRDALADAGLSIAPGGGKSDHHWPYAPHRCGAMLGTTLHGMRAAGQYLRSGDAGALRDFLAGATLRRALGALPIEGLAATTCSACSSSLGSVALAMTLLRTGQLDLVIAGGYDTISEYAYAGFNSLRLVAAGPLRPFAKERQGMKLAEGYGIVILERASGAAARGVRALATVLGCGESADAHHLTQPHPQGEGASRAISAALASANCSAADIDLIAAHATGTPDNDAAEFAALQRVFGDELARVSIVGFKSHLGHTLGGAGAVELILSACAMRDSIVPACANLAPHEIEFAALRVSTGKSTALPIRRTLNTSLGFGGANTCVVLGPPVEAKSALIMRVHTSSPGTPGEGRGQGDFEHRETLGTRNHPHPSPLPAYRERESEHAAAAKGLAGDCDVIISGVGVVFPGAVGNDAFLARLGSPNSALLNADGGAVAEETYIHLLNARRVRRMSEYVKLSLAATTLALQDAGIENVASEGGFGERCSVVLGTAHGSAHYSAEYYGQVVREGWASANPMLFAEGVPNAAAAHLSLMLSLRGACQAIVGTRTAGLDALRLAAMKIACGEWDRAIVGAAEEEDPHVNAAYRACGHYVGASGQPAFSPAAGGFVTSAGAVTFILESRSAWNVRQVGRADTTVIASASLPSQVSNDGLARPRAVWIGGSSARAAGGDAPSLVNAATRLLGELGQPRNVLSSANATWVDRMEAAAIGSVSRDDAPTTVSSIYGHVAETFSVAPLAALAAAILSRRMPTLLGGGLTSDRAGAHRDARLVGARGDELLTSVVAICTDYSGVVSAAAFDLPR